MFTGLIQHLGTLKRVTPRGSEAEIEIAAELGPLEVGESVAVSGACLTVTAAGPGFFRAFASEETLAKTRFGAMRAGAAVNLERALRAGDPLGGHLVTGHVDARVELLQRTRVGEAERFSIALPPPPLGRQIAAKGSVAIDGVSLTVNGVRDRSFEVMVIPLTLSSTTLGRTAPGDPVHVETDVLAKYVARQLEGGGAAPGGVDMALLEKAGYLR